MSEFEEWKREARWIPVSERLPDRSLAWVPIAYEGGRPDVLITGHSNFLHEAYGHVYNSWGWSSIKIRYWMEPPPPPEVNARD